DPANRQEPQQPGGARGGEGIPERRRAATQAPRPLGKAAQETIELRRPSVGSAIAKHLLRKIPRGRHFCLHHGVIRPISRVPFASKSPDLAAAGYLSTGWGGVQWPTPIPSSNWGWT